MLYFYDVWACIENVWRNIFRTGWPSGIRFDRIRGIVNESANGSVPHPPTEIGTLPPRRAAVFVIERTQLATIRIRQARQNLYGGPCWRLPSPLNSSVSIYGAGFPGLCAIVDLARIGARHR